MLPRFVAWLFGAVFATFVAAALLLPLYFDPNDYKDEIANRVEDATGRKLTIAGDIDLTVFPWLGMTLRDARLSNAPGFGDEPFAEVGELQASVRLLPLFRKEIEVGTVSLDGLLLRLARNAEGRNNWQDIKEHRARRQPQAEEDGGPKEGRFKVKSLDIAGVEIENSAVEWHNAANGQRYRLGDFHFTTGQLQPGAPFDLDSGFVLTSGTAGRSTEFNLAGRVEPTGKERYTVDGLELTAIAEGIAGGKQKIVINGDVDYHTRKQELHVTQLELDALGEEIAGELHASSVLDAPKYSGRVDADSINPRKLMRTFGSNPPGSSSVLNDASFKAAFAGDSRRVDFRDVSMQLDDTHMNGTLNVTEFQKPLIGFDLRVDTIDLNRYMGGGGSARKAGTGNGGADEPAEFKGHLRVGSLKVKQLLFQNADLYLHAKGGNINVSPMTAGFYQGQVSGSGRFNTQTSTYAVNAKLNGIRTEKLMTALTGKAPIDGTGNANVNLRGSGAGARAMDGTVRFDIRNGELNGVDLPYKLRQAYALYQGRKLADAPSAATPFSVLAATLNVNNGVLSSSNLDGKTPGIDVDADGHASLVSRTLNFLAQVGITGAPSGKNWPEFEKLKGLEIPVQIYGSFSNPRWKINLAGLLRGALEAEVRQEIDQQLARQKEELDQRLAEEKGKLTDRLEDRLQELVGGRDKKATGDVASMEAREKSAASEEAAATAAAAGAEKSTATISKETAAERRARREAERAERKAARLAKQRAEQEARAKAKAEAEAAASSASEPAPADET